jgi:hypothetical protein
MRVPVDMSLTWRQDIQRIACVIRSDPFDFPPRLR